MTATGSKVARRSGTRCAFAKCASMASMPSCGLVALVLFWAFANAARTTLVTAAAVNFMAWLGDFGLRKKRYWCKVRRGVRNGVGVMTEGERGRGEDGGGLG